MPWVEKKVTAGFLVPLGVDRSDEDWIFRHGLFCRDLADMKHYVEHVTGDALVATRGTMAFVPQHLKELKMFREYREPVERMMVKAGEADPTGRKIWGAKGDMVMLLKIPGQRQTTSGFLIPNMNRMHNDSDLVYVPDIERLWDYVEDRAIRFLYGGFTCEEETRLAEIIERREEDDE